MVFGASFSNRRQTMLPSVVLKTAYMPGVRAIYFLAFLDREFIYCDGVGFLTAAGFLVPDRPLGAAGLATASAPRRISMCVIFTGRSGRSPSVAMRAICLTSSTAAGSHWPKIV